MTKKSCIIYKEWALILQRLPKDKAGELIVAFVAYVFDDEEKSIKDDPSLDAMLEAMKLRADEDLKKYEEKVERVSKARKKKTDSNHDEISMKSDSNHDDINSVNVNVNVNDNDNVYPTDIVKEKTPTVSKRKSDKRFCPPSLQEVQAYCLERNNTIDAEKFMDYHISNGWKVGKNAMKDWKAAVRTWEKREGYDRPNRASPPKSTKFSNFTERSGDISDLEKKLISV